MYCRRRNQNRGQPDPSDLLWLWAAVSPNRGQTPAFCWPEWPLEQAWGVFAKQLHRLLAPDATQRAV